MSMLERFQQYIDNCPAIATGLNSGEGLVAFIMTSPILCLLILLIVFRRLRVWLSVVAFLLWCPFIYSVLLVAASPIMFPGPEVQKATGLGIFFWIFMVPLTLLSTPFAAYYTIKLVEKICKS